MFTGVCKMVGSILRAACREFWHFDREILNFQLDLMILLFENTRQEL
jgi:hypothetical protein